MTDHRFETPESGVDSGALAPSGAGSATRPAPAETVTPEAGPDGVVPDGPLDAPAVDGEQKPEAGVEAEGGAPDGETPSEAFADAGVDLAALTAKAEKADQYLDLAQRTRAEFDNYRKRATREAAAAQERGAAKLALELLPAIDNLDRALAHAATSGETENGDASLVSGIKHVQTDVIAAFKRAGIEPFSPEGEQFDPQFHEAIAQQPFEGAQPGTVVEVYQRGYRLGDSVLRPARVVVAG